MQAILEVENLTAGYSDVNVLRDISFSLQPREILGIVGESGCGKSTLLKALAQIRGLSTQVNSGSIRFKGKSLNHISEKEKRAMLGAEIAFVFQHAHNSLHPTKKIQQQFYDVAEAHTKMTKKEVRERAFSLFDSLGLNDGERIMHSYPFELSGGMAQRVSLALAVLLKPDLILADEPTSALDTTVQKQVIEELLLLREALGTAMIVITHNMGVVDKIADYVGVMYGGRIVEYGPTKEVLQAPRHPYTQALLQAVPTFGGELPQGLKGRPPQFSELDKGCAFAMRCPAATAACNTYDNQRYYVGPNHYVICLQEESNV